MTVSKLVALVKFFTDERHADQFLKGCLHMRRLRYFQKLEAFETDDGRADANEAVVTWHQPNRIVSIVIDTPGMEPITIPGSDLAGPFSDSRNFYSEMHLFCVSAIRIPDPSTLLGSHSEIENQLQEAVRLDPRCLDFGPHAVVMRSDRFISQLDASLKQYNHWYAAHMVEYYDEKSFHGDFDMEDVPFRKQNRFAYQKEFRVCVQTPTIGNDPIDLEIGDISSFAWKVRSADINQSFRLTLKQT